MRTQVMLPFIFILILLIGLSPQVFGSYDLWRINQDGEDLKQITNVNSPYRIDWKPSPSGALIVAGSFMGLQIIDWDGVVLNMYPGEKGVIYLPVAWNDEGIYACTYENQNYTKLVLLSANDFQQIAEWELNVRYLPSISPDGKYLYLIKKTLFSYTGYLLNLETDKLKKIGRSFDLMTAKWSRDSQFFTFMDNHLRESIRNLTGKIVYKFPEESVALNWSFDDKFILYYNFADKILYVFDIDKRNIITKIAAQSVYEADWSRDNKHFIFAETDNENEIELLKRVWVGNIDGEALPVVPDSDRIYDPVWAFNETFVIFNKNTLEEFSFKPASEYDFRKTNWGMSKAEVLEAEDGTVVYENEELIVFAVHIAEFQSSLLYCFDKDKLSFAFYYLPQDADETCFTNYEKLKEMLTKEYGAPLTTKALRKTKEYAGEPDIEAILKNDVEIITIWDNVILVMSSSDGEIAIRICYGPGEFHF